MALPDAINIHKGKQTLSKRAVAGKVPEVVPVGRRIIRYLLSRYWVGRHYGL
jgi:hypothetical protein